MTKASSSTIMKSIRLTGIVMSRIYLRARRITKEQRELRDNDLIRITVQIYYFALKFTV